jgi:hypothetical protein
MRKIVHTGMLLARASCRTSTLPVSTCEQNGALRARVDMKHKRNECCRVLQHYEFMVGLAPGYALIHTDMLLARASAGPQPCL